MEIDFLSEIEISNVNISKLPFLPDIWIERPHKWLRLTQWTETITYLVFEHPNPLHSNVMFVYIFAIKVLSSARNIPFYSIWALDKKNTSIKLKHKFDFGNFSKSIGFIQMDRTLIFAIKYKVNDMKRKYSRFCSAKNENVCNMFEWNGVRWSSENVWFGMVYLFGNSSKCKRSINVYFGSSQIFNFPLKAIFTSRTFAIAEG